MAEFNYILSSPDIDQTTGLSNTDNTLSGTVTLNSRFNIATDYVEILRYDSAGTFISRTEGTSQVKELLSSNSTEQGGTSTLFVDPLTFAKEVAPQQNTTLEYLFLRRSIVTQFFISEISPDGLELRLTANSSTDLSTFEDIQTLLERFKTETYLPKLLLEISPTNKILVVNIELDGPDLILKLYSAINVGLRTSVRLIEQIADTVKYSITATQIPIEIKQPALRGPNFNIDLDDQSDVSTEYLDYTELFSQPITGTNSKIFAEMSGSGVGINVDYSEFSNFVHFSSARERLVNFKYKLDLIQSYEASQAANQAINNSTNAVQVVSDKYDKLIKGVISNFDGYERHLYFESGSTSWPKVSNNKPYENELSTAQVSINWLEGTLASASLYDELNESRLTYTIPEYIRQDNDNNPASLFTDMIGQHFDELWTYANGITDKYDADNRLEYGISKDLVVKTLQNFGVNLYSSNFSTGNLTKLLLGEWYDPGQENITSFITATTEPTPDKDLLHETYKRIYHNLPYLIKTKGTERGLRALINCFGVPSGSIQIREFGGLPTRYDFSPGYSYYADPSEKIRLENTGSKVPGNTVSQYTSIIKPSNDRSQDLHVLEVGFSPSYYIDEYLTAYTLPPSFAEGDVLISNTFAFPNFRIDDYIGDPRNTTERRYKDLNVLRDKLLGSLDMYDVFDFVRLIKFFDNQLFKMIKDFVPARDTVSTGIIIKPHFLNRSKVGGTLPIVERSEYSASIDTAFVTGSTPGLLEEHDVTNTVINVTPIGVIQEESTDQKEKVNGELGGTSIVVTTGELNDENIYKRDNTPYTTFNTSRSIEQALQLPGYVDTYPQTSISSGTINIRYLDTGLGAPGSSQYSKLDGKVSKLSANGLNLSGGMDNLTSIYLQGELFVITSMTEYVSYYYFQFKRSTASTLITGNTLSQVILSGYVDKDFYVNDYNALLGNASKVDTATRLQKVNYENGVIPTNLDAIRNGTAEKADVQEYLHNSFGIRSGRYLGKQMEGKEYNRYYIGDKSYGNSPVIEYTDAYFAYFRWVKSASPLLGNHTLERAYLKLWYLLDKDGNQTGLGNDSKGITLSKVQQNFKEGTNVSLTLDSSATGDYSTLNDKWRILRSGQKVVPIIYSQTSTTDTAGNITGYDKVTTINFGIPGEPAIGANFTGDTNMGFSANAVGGLEIRENPTEYNIPFSGINPYATDQTYLQGYGPTYNSSGEYFEVQPDPTESTAQPFKMNFTVVLSPDFKPLKRTEFKLALEKSTNGGTTWTTVGQEKLIKLDHQGTYVEFLILQGFSSVTGTLSGPGAIKKEFVDEIPAGTTGPIRYRVRIKNVDRAIGAGLVELTSNTYIKVNQSPVAESQASGDFWTTGPNSLTVVTASNGADGLSQFYTMAQGYIPESNFPDSKYPFTVYPGDEIRFGANEDNTFTVLNVGTGLPITLELDREVRLTQDELNLFVIRRYIPDPSYLILDIPDASNGAAPGVVTTEYPADGLEDNIDTIVAKLKSENSI